MPESVIYKLEQQIEEYLTELLDGYKPKRYRDDKVIRDTIGGFVRLYPHEVAVVDSPLFQRLRHIFQTSLAIFTYPSANHSRFEHSLGCLSMADKIIHAIEKKSPGMLTIQEQYEIRLAALLHDVGHGPFSHASESYYETYEEIRAIKEEEPDLFKEASAHEILGYFILKAKKFKEFWQNIVDLYEPEGTDKKVLRHIIIDHIPPLILGKPFDKNKRFIAQIINGPFDVDKLDYLQRDGYFSGIQTALDIERLFLTIGVHTDTRTGIQSLYTDVSGATVLEQLMFNKMILFSCLYHHHKVRAALLGIHFLFDMIKNDETHKLNINGLELKSVVDYLRVDDYDVFKSAHIAEELSKVIKRIKNRNLLMRALVICPLSLKDSRTPMFSSLQGNKNLREEIRKAICNNDIQLNDVYIDCPKPPKFLGGTLESCIRLTEKDFITLESLYPVSGWVSGYAEYRYRGYIFSTPGKESAVGRRAYNILNENGLELNEKAFLLARRTP